MELLYGKDKGRARWAAAMQAYRERVGQRTALHVCVESCAGLKEGGLGNRLPGPSVAGAAAQLVAGLLDRLVGS